MMPFFEPSQKFKAIVFRASASFTYLFIFRYVPWSWWTIGLMWVGLVCLKYVDSAFPWSKECPAHKNQSLEV